MITSYLVDDEPLAVSRLRRLLEATGRAEIAGSSNHPSQAVEELRRLRPAVLFLDIEMPYITGIDFLQRANLSPKVIFTTAYEQYAMKGYELDVMDYLLKPISFDRFLKAANKAYDYFVSRNPGEDKYLFVKTDNKLEKVNFDDILFVEAMENYVAIYTGEKKLITHSTLKLMQENLPALKFIQPHKSYLVNIDAINSIEGNMLHVNKFQIPISKYQKEDIMERIVNNKLLKK